MHDTIVDDLAVWLGILPLVLGCGVRAVYLWETKRRKHAVAYLSIMVFFARIGILRIGTNGGLDDYYEAAAMPYISFLGSDPVFALCVGFVLVACSVDLLADEYLKIKGQLLLQRHLERRKIRQAIAARSRKEK